MADSERRRGGDDAEESGPGAVYMQFALMEDVLDKLKLLQYEMKFCKQFSIKPFSRHYFAMATNPGEQFYSFTSLSAWLLRIAGKHMDQPQEYDDPNATIASILDALRQFLPPPSHPCAHCPHCLMMREGKGDNQLTKLREGHSIDFPPSKLKQGCGEQCVFVLDKLSSEALKYTSFSWAMPEYPEEEMEEEAVIEEEAEISINKKEEEVDAADDEDEYVEENIMDLEGLKKLAGTSEDSKPVEIMESTTDAAEWKLEVERVLPQLKVTIRTDNKDWRVHVDQMHQHRDGINSTLSECRSHLDKLHDDITRTLEKIGSREKYINTQLEHSLQEFRHMQDQLAETKERYRQGSGGVTERARVLAEVTEELERVKQEMEERGSSMTDGAPLVKIKQAIARLKSENTQMDIRIGVLEHVLLQAKMADRNESQRSMQHNETEGESYEIKAY